MAQEGRQPDDIVITGFPLLEIPLMRRPTEDELKARKRQVARARQIRDEIGPIDIATDELLHLSREASSQE